MAGQMPGVCRLAASLSMAKSLTRGMCPRKSAKPPFPAAFSVFSEIAASGPSSFSTSRAQPAGYLRSLSPAMLMPIPPLYCSYRSKLSSCQSRMGNGQVVGRLLSSLVYGNPFGRPSDIRHSYRTGSEVAPLKPPNHLCCRACQPAGYQTPPKFEL